LKLRVTSREEAVDAVRHRKLRPSAIFSIGGFGFGVFDMPSTLAIYGEDKGVPVTRLEFDDVPCPTLAGSVPPSYEDVARALEPERRGEHPRVILIHCAAGISRSTGIALSLHASEQPGRTLADARRAYSQLHNDILDTKAAGLRGHTAYHPNPRIIWHADAILGYDGALLEVQKGSFGFSWDDIDQPAGAVSVPTSKEPLCEK
jgi:predicted protein tyrosine phosphatase